MSIYFYTIRYQCDVKYNLIYRLVYYSKKSNLNQGFYFMETIIEQYPIN